MATFAKPGTTSISTEEGKIDRDGTLPIKRKPEVMPQDIDNITEVGDELSKKKKLDIPSVDEDELMPRDVEDSKGVSEAENSGTQLNEEVEVEDEDDEDEDEEEDYEDDDEDEDGSEQSNDGPEVNDPKGKGILKDEKGKGKLIEESEDSDDSGTGSSDGESDLSDDPLTEVDLNNILPSRTRSCAVKPRASISIDGRSKDDKDDDNTS